MKIEQLGRHILAEFYNCDGNILNDHALIEKYMIEAAEHANATVVKSCRLKPLKLVKYQGV